MDRSLLSWEDPSALFPSPPTSPLTKIPVYEATAIIPTGPQYSVTGTWAKASLPIVVSVPSVNVLLGESVPVTIQMNCRPSTAGSYIGVVVVEGRVVIQQYRVARSVHVGINPNKVVQKLITVPLPSPWPTQMLNGTMTTVEGTSRIIPVMIPFPSAESRARFSPTALYPSLKSKHFDVEHHVSVILRLRLAGQKDRQSMEVEVSQIPVPVQITNPRPADRATTEEEWAHDYDDEEHQREFNRVHSRYHWVGSASRQEDVDDELPSYTD